MPQTQVKHIINIPHTMQDNAAVDEVNALVKHGDVQSKQAATLWAGAAIAGLIGLITMGLVPLSETELNILMVIMIVLVLGLSGISLMKYIKLDKSVQEISSLLSPYFAEVDVITYYDAQRTQRSSFLHMRGTYLKGKDSGIYAKVMYSPEGRIVTVEEWVQGARS